MTTTDSVNTKMFRNYDDPTYMLDLGATTNVNNPITIQYYMNIKIPWYIVDVVNKALRNHGYEKFTKDKLYNTTQDTRLSNTDE